VSNRQKKMEPTIIESAMIVRLLDAPRRTKSGTGHGTDSWAAAG